MMGDLAVDQVWGFGPLHCLTQQQPQAGRVTGLTGATGRAEET